MIVKKMLILQLLLTVQYLSGMCQQKKIWHPKAISIPTRWTADVKPSKVLSEYPRPAMIRASEWTNLNGLWAYCVTDTQNVLPTVFKDSILVPYPIESALSGVQKSLFPSQNLWYKREFLCDSKRAEKILLHFGAVDWKSTIYINGYEVLSHTGGYNSFSCDITNYLRKGTNTLIVKVYDPTDRGIGPHGKQVLNPSNIYYTPSSGIWQTVWLEHVPNNYIDRIRLTPDIDKGLVRLKVTLNQQHAIYYIKATVLTTGKSAQGKSNQDLDIRIPDAQLWSPDHPYLYDIKVELIDLQSGRTLDIVQTYVGMRKVSIEKDQYGYSRIFLNNNYVFNFGTLDQGFWPDGLYTAPTDSALAYDIGIIKAMGFNTIRKHIKIEPERWYYFADKIGMLVWQDFVNPNQSLPIGAKREFEKELETTVDQLYNHPSIVTWVLFNEKWGQYDQKRLTEWVKRLDSTRIVNGHSGELLFVDRNLRSPSPMPYISSDIADVHSYPYPMMPPDLPGKVKVLGEYGGIGVPIEGQLWDDLTPGWGYQGVGTPDTLKKQYSKMIDSIVAMEKKGLAASIYTQPFDVESEQNGLLTYNRSIVKIPIDTIKYFNSKVIPSSKQGNFHLAYAPDVAVYNPNVYKDMLKMYSNGIRDSLFLRSLLIKSSRQHDSIMKNDISKQYFTTVLNPLNEPNIRLLWAVTNSVKDTGFVIIKSHINEVNSVLGMNAAENFLMQIIFQDAIRPVINSREVNWDSLEKKIVPRFGHLALERIVSSKVMYYAGLKDWKKFGEYYKKHFDNVLITGRNNLHINNISWPVFLYVDDKEVLGTAIKIMEYNIEKFDRGQANSIDTYANLLYKFGRKAEAIEQERRAMKLSEDKIFRETYEKMLRGEKTWENSN